jgi:hypothetical protein
VVVREIMVRETSHVGYVQRSGSPSEQSPIALTTSINQPALTVKPTAERTFTLSTWSIAPWYVARSLVLWLFAKSWLGKRDHHPGNKYRDRFTYPTYPRSISRVGYVQRSGSPSEQPPIALTTSINQPALTVKPTAERTLALSTWSIAPRYVARSLVLWLFAK